jgi:hypothetical protein
MRAGDKMALVKEETSADDPAEVVPVFVELEVAVPA